MVKFMYDFLSTSLMIRNSYYESLVEKTNDLSKFYETTVVRKKDLHSQNHDVTLEMIDLQDQIAKIDSQLEDIQISINSNIQRRKEKEQLEKELDKIVKKKIKTIKKANFDISKVVSREHEFELHNIKYDIIEEYLLEILSRVVNKDSIAFQVQEGLKALFRDKKYLWKVLVSMKDRDQSDSKNWDSSIANIVKKIEHIKSQVKESERSIQKREAEWNEIKDSLIEKYDEWQAIFGDLGHAISSTEISNVRSAQIINSISEISETAKEKLEKTQERIKNILGDCILLSCSVVYLGIFWMKKKIEFRKNLRESLKSFNITSSTEWYSEDPQTHWEIFKEICEENGIHKIFNTTEITDNIDNLRAWFMNINQSEDIIDDEQQKKSQFDRTKLFDLNPVFSENLFSLLFSPSTPICFDSSGLLSEFVKRYLLQTSLNDLHNSKSQTEGVFKEESNLLNESQGSISQTEKNFPQKVDVICLNDMNFTIPEGASTKYIKALKSQYAPYLEFLKTKENKKVSIMDSGLSIFQTNLFVNNFKFTLGEEYEAKCTMMLVELDWLNTREESWDKMDSVVSQVNYWVTIKMLFMKHFPQSIEDEEGQKLDMYDYFMDLQNKIIPKLKNQLESYQTNFENIFWMAKSLHDKETYSQLKANIANIKETQDKLQKALRQYQTILDENHLVNTYSKYLCCLYRAMTTLCKLVDEPVYTWKMFLKIVDVIIIKKKREQAKKEESDEEQSDNEDSDKHLQEYKQKLGMSEKIVEWNFDFLYSGIIPNIYAVIWASYSTENVPLLNLLFGLEIGNQRGSFSRPEQDFFLESLWRFKNYKDWRKSDTSFVRLSEKFDESEYLRVKKYLSKFYPDQRELFDKVNANVKTYKDMMNILFNNETEKNSLMEDINLRFLCPDDEFRSKIWQLVYEELLATFEFNEDPVKLHSFIKAASWPYPIAVKTFESINIVNTVWSIASFYGVGLEVIRTDTVNPTLTDPNYHTNQFIKANFNDEDSWESNEGNHKNSNEKDYHPIPQILETKPAQSFSMKYKSSDAQEPKKRSGVDLSLDIIEKWAQNGTWVLISTPEFPSFWKKVCHILEKVNIVNSFRIFIDLQSIDVNTVPPTFFWDNWVRFIMTEANNEDMEGFNDIWANILNGDIINNSENISEHPSLAVDHKKFVEKKADLSHPNNMIGDISVIDKEAVIKSQNVVAPVDISKEEGEILKEITIALDKDQAKQESPDQQNDPDGNQSLDKIEEDQKDDSPHSEHPEGEGQENSNFMPQQEIEDENDSEIPRNSQIIAIENQLGEGDSENNISGEVLEETKENYPFEAEGEGGSQKDSENRTLEKGSEAINKVGDVAVVESNPNPSSENSKKQENL